MTTPTPISHWIDGQLQEGTSGRTAPVFNPATGVQSGVVALADESEADAAIRSAAAAARVWRETSLAKRTAVLFAFRELLHANIGELRGIGYMWALEAVKNAETKEPFPGKLSVSERIANTCTDLGLICRPLGQSIVLCPPFILTDAQMDEMFEKLDAALTRVFDGLRAEGEA